MNCNIEKLTDSVYLYGAGLNGNFAFDYFSNAGIKVVAFIDSDPQKWGVIKGVPCISYEEYLKKDDQFPVFITPRNSVRQIRETVENGISFDCYFAESHADDYSTLKFEDERSYKTLNGLLSYMKSGEYSFLWEISESNQYFSVSPFFMNANEVFVDLGAYVGDTIERFISTSGDCFKKIYAFEPGERQLSALMLRLERIRREWLMEADRFIVERKCVSAKSGISFFSDMDDFSRSHISEHDASTEIRTTTLDDYFADQDVTFIKTDIEGEDYNAIVGGRKLIERCKPKLAISVYHRPDDLLRIYRLIDGFGLGYRFKLRHHSNMIAESVLYCY